MKICIIGATLARKLTAAGHSVRIANSRGPETLKEVAEQTGASAMMARTNRSCRTRPGRGDQLTTADVVRLNRTMGA